MLRNISKPVLLFFLLILFVSQGVFAGGSKETGINANGTSSVANVKKAVSLKWITVDENGNVNKIDEKGTTNLVPPLDAIGAEYVDASGNVVLTEYFETDEVWLGNWINYLSSAMNQVVFRIALALHPFPNTMFSLYGLDLGVTAAGTVSLTMKPDAKSFNNFETKQLLISNQYYTTSRDIKTADGMQGGYVPMAESNSSTDPSPLQKQKWSLVTMLFVSCFVAEILFTAIYGYATGSSEEGGASLLKNIAKKCAVTLVLFVLVSALPFLLEAFRYGLFKIAYGFYGEAANGYENELAKNGYSRENLVNDVGEVTNIFELPGFFLQSMKSFFAKSGSSLIKNSLSNYMAGSTGEEKSQSLITHCVTWILSLIFRFVMFVMILKCAIHIAKNILEVYILLGLVMILTPFAVFTPMKTLGAKCIMSLVSNVIECFIILVVILTVIPAVKMTTVSMLAMINSLSSAGTYKESTDYTTIISDPLGTNNKLNFIAANDFVMAICSLGTKGDKVAFTYSPLYPEGNKSMTEIKRAEGVKFEINFSEVSTVEELVSGGKVKVDAWDKGLEAKISVKDGKLYEGDNKKSYDIFKNSSLLKMIATSVWEGGFKKDVMGEDFKTQAALEEATKYFWLLNDTDNNDNLERELYALTMIDDDARRVYTQYSQYIVYTCNIKKTSDVAPYVMTATTDSVTALMFLQFTLIFMSMFLPCYFVQQSTHITNSLLNGTAGLESLANATSDVIGRTSRGIQRAAGGLVSGVGNIARGINTHNSNTSQASQANAAQRTADATSAMLDMMRQGNGNNSSS